MVAIINEGLWRAMTAMAGLRTRLTEERGQDLLEYAILSGFIAAALAGVLATAIFTDALDGMVGGISACIDFDGTTPCP
ncbi:MAG: hypothetical protein WD939_05680 [Dehalococcoidia bacterium]